MRAEDCGSRSETEQVFILIPQVEFGQSPGEMRGGVITIHSPKSSCTFDSGSGHSPLTDQGTLVVAQSLGCQSWKPGTEPKCSPSTTLCAHSLVAPSVHYMPHRQF